MTVTKARAALSRCESELRSLLSEAANSGDYDSALKLTSWAKAVAALGRENPTPAVESASLQARRKARATSYPRFERRGDSLVKIGWSKRDKSEYEHKAALWAVSLVADAVAKMGTDGRLFQISGLLSCIAPDGDAAVPDYQVYLIIAWWREMGLLEQHGRQGYSIPNPIEFPSRVALACHELAKA